MEYCIDGMTMDEEHLRYRVQTVHRADIIPFPRRTVGYVPPGIAASMLNISPGTFALMCETGDVPDYIRPIEH